MVDMELNRILDEFDAWLNSLTSEELWVCYEKNLVELGYKEMYETGIPHHNQD